MVDAISRLATPESQEAVIEEALGLSAAALDRQARRHGGMTASKAKSVWERRQLVRQWNLDESELRFRGRLPDAEGRIFDRAIDSRVDVMGPNPETGIFDPFEARSADALVETAASGGGIGSHPSEVSIFADLESLTTRDQGRAHLDNTAPIPNTTAQRLACDATIEAIVRDGGQVIGIGRRSRKIPGWLRRLVHQRDGGVCQHPGCGNTRWLQVHHIVSWATGGATDLDNLILSVGSTIGSSTSTAGTSPGHPRRGSSGDRIGARIPSTAVARNETRRTGQYLGAAAPVSDHQSPDPQQGTKNP